MKPHQSRRPAFDRLLTGVRTGPDQPDYRGAGDRGALEHRARLRGEQRGGGVGPVRGALLAWLAPAQHPSAVGVCLPVSRATTCTPHRGRWSASVGEKCASFCGLCSARPWPPSAFSGPGPSPPGRHSLLPLQMPRRLACNLYNCSTKPHTGTRHTRTDAVVSVAWGIVTISSVDV